MIDCLPPEELEIITSVLAHFESLYEAAIFGSRAKGNSRPGSDVDLSIKGCTYSEIVTISMKLNEETILPYFFDVVAFETIKNDQLIDHINRVGKVIYKK